MSFSKKYMEETKSNGIFFTQSTIENDDEEEQEQFLPKWVDDLTKATSSSPKSVFAKDISMTGGKKLYTSDLSHEQMLQYQETLPRMDIIFYEIILDDRAMKPFYDIDKSPEITNTVYLSQLINEIINITATSLKELYNIDGLDYTDFTVMDSSGHVKNPTGKTTKTSFHIVLVNKAHFHNIHDMKEFVQFIFSDYSGYVKQNMDFSIDHGVYKKRGLLKIPGSTKRGQTRHLRIIMDHSPCQCLLTFTDVNEDVKVIERPTKRNNKR
jgi:hypothetical protein